jgi:hypothetical protein
MIFASLEERIKNFFAKKEEIKGHEVFVFEEEIKKLLQAMNGESTKGASERKGAKGGGNMRVEDLQFGEVEYPDLREFDGKKAKIERIDIMDVNIPGSLSSRKVMKFITEPVGEINGRPVVASRLFSLFQNSDGEWVIPKNSKKLNEFLTKYKIKHPAEAIGLEVTVVAFAKTVNNVERTFLSFV